MAPRPSINAPPRPISIVPVALPAVCKVTGVGVGPSATGVVGVAVAAIVHVQFVCAVH